ncbi:MAG: biotin--[acetyl-CoA-carboxylase] ligase [Actinobacteria bacterium]|nr:biotin--[acetyl-CoA-carboxylase] ligase [Actinomycetota bacterium]
MKGSPVLAVLRERWGEFVSGEELARSSGISRSAIWKQINQLRATGYGIEASTRRGYRLVALTDRLLPEELSWQLGTSTIGCRIIHFDEVGSTNEEAKALAAGGAEDGTVVIAERQTGGRGRLGRGWFSPPGGIWMSIILRPRIIPGDAPRVMMIAATSVVAAVRRLGLPAKIKWPNDVMIAEKKVAGILTEMAGQPDMVDHLVVGIGLNANIPPGEFPSDLIPVATSLSIEAGREIDKLTLARRLLQELDARYSKLKEGRLDEVLDEWRRTCATLGQDVRLSTASGEIRGVAIDVDERGSLILKLPDGATRSFAAGDVTVIKG